MFEDEDDYGEPHRAPRGVTIRVVVGTICWIVILVLMWLACHRWAS